MFPKKTRYLIYIKIAEARAKEECNRNETSKSFLQKQKMDKEKESHLEEI
ncbi:hypothetical protein RV18_GL001860 [Enterococcus termitis]|nr:hypothetical protein RV18_GL001860 [Enterococcus termitis]